jgi:hypothetical protein
MTLVPWGNLKKSAVIDETVEQAIDRLVAVHEADETSHLGVGESLQSHKASAIIDHAALSIIEDKIASGEISSRCITNDQIIAKDFRTAADVGAGVDGVKFNSGGIEMWQSGEKKVNIPISGDPSFAGKVSVKELNFLKPTWLFGAADLALFSQSIGGTGEIVPNPLLTRITAGNVLYDLTNIFLNLTAEILYFFVQDPIFQASVLLDDPDRGDAYWGFGDRNPLTDSTYFFVGFRTKAASPTKTYVSYRIAAAAWVDFEVASSPDIIRVYRIESFNDGALLYFYIDNVLVHTIENVFVDLSTVDFLSFGIIDVDAGFTPSLYVNNVMYQQNHSYLL